MDQRHLQLRAAQLEVSGGDDEHGPLGHSGLLSRPNCEVCPLRGSRIVPPNGNLQAKIALVGEGPGENEVRAGRGFVGKSGRLLNILLTRAGIDRATCWTTNAALCAPRPVTMQNQDGTLFNMSLEDVKAASVRACRPRLLEELAAIRAAVIVPIGALALQAVTGIEDGIQVRRGGVHIADIAIQYTAAWTALQPVPPKQKKARRKKPQAEETTATVVEDNGHQTQGPVHK